MVSTVRQVLNPTGQGVSGFAGPGNRSEGATLKRKFLRFVLGSFFRHRVFLTTWLGLFLGSFLCVYVLSTTYRLRFWVHLGSFFLRVFYYQ